MIDCHKTERSNKGQINKGAMVKILVSSKKPIIVMADNQPL